MEVVIFVIRNKTYFLRFFLFGAIQPQFA